LGPGGRIADRLPHYEHRPQQLEMAEAVAESLKHGKHLVVEAGTGVGKSFAYLVPAILHVASQEREEDEEPLRIVVSTHTISLQEQLLTKDIPLLRSVTPYEFTAVLAKGRRNYISIRRFEKAVARGKTIFNYEGDFDQLRRISRWLQTTSDGSRADLPFEPSLPLWDEAASDTGNCLGRNCDHFKSCFYFAARRRVQNAQIIIVNHALFFSDLALRKQGVNLLPNYDAVIIDEAHTLEEVASSHLGLGLTTGQIDYALNKLYNDRTNKGLLVEHRLKTAQNSVLNCRREADTFFGDLHAWLERGSGPTARVTEPEIVPNALSPALLELASHVDDHAETLNEEAERKDYISASERLTGLANELEIWRRQEADDWVYWLESSRTNRQKLRLKLHAAPIDVGPALQKELFETTRSVILTSATLGVGKEGSFDFFQSRVGLEKATPLRLGSPFDYRKQATLVVVKGMPDPSRDQQAFEEATQKMIQRYVARSDGRAFVLFTSYASMRRAASELGPWLAEHDLGLYSQSDGTPRNLMLEKFRDNPRSVLMGVASFWQGVDVPGDALKNVIIPKLPFSVPDHPLLQARLDKIRETGGNPFMDYQLPEAIIKLRQGFGRLIRSARDEGMVVLLDPRIRSKPYGKKFIESLPDCELIEETVD